MESSIAANDAARDNSLTAPTSMSEGAAESYLRDFPDMVRSPSPVQISKCNSPSDLFSVRACELEVEPGDRTEKTGAPYTQASAAVAASESVKSAMLSPFRVTAGTAGETLLNKKSVTAATAVSTATRASPSGPHRILNPAAKEFQMPSWSLLATMQPSSALNMANANMAHTQEPCDMNSMDGNMRGVSIGADATSPTPLLSASNFAMTWNPTISRSSPAPAPIAATTATAAVLPTANAIAPIFKSFTDPVATASLAPAGATTDDSTSMQRQMLEYIHTTYLGPAASSLSSEGAICGVGGGGSAPTSISSLQQAAATHIVAVFDLSPTTTNSQLADIFFPMGASDAVVLEPKYMPAAVAQNCLTTRRRAGVVFFPDKMCALIGVEKLNNFVPNGQHRPLVVQYCGIAQSVSPRATESASSYTLQLQQQQLLQQIRQQQQRTASFSSSSPSLSSPMSALLMHGSTGSLGRTPAAMTMNHHTPRAAHTVSSQPDTHIALDTPPLAPSNTNTPMSLVHDAVGAAHAGTNYAAAASAAASANHVPHQHVLMHTNNSSNNYSTTHNNISVMTSTTPNTSDSATVMQREIDRHFLEHYADPEVHLVGVHNLCPQTTNATLYKIFYPMGAFSSELSEQRVGVLGRNSRRSGVALFRSAAVAREAAAKLNNFVPHGQTRPILAYYLERKNDNSNSSIHKNDNTDSKKDSTHKESVVGIAHHTQPPTPDTTATHAIRTPLAQTSHPYKVNATSNTLGGSNSTVHHRDDSMVVVPDILLTAHAHSHAHATRDDLTPSGSTSAPSSTTPHHTDAVRENDIHVPSSTAESVTANGNACAADRATSDTAEARLRAVESALCASTVDAHALGDAMIRFARHPGAECTALAALLQRVMRDMGHHVAALATPLLTALLALHTALGLRARAVRGGNHSNNDEDGANGTDSYSHDRAYGACQNSSNSSSSNHAHDTDAHEHADSVTLPNGTSGELCALAVARAMMLIVADDSASRPARHVAGMLCGYLFQYRYMGDKSPYTLALRLLEMWQHRCCPDDAASPTRVDAAHTWQTAMPRQQTCDQDGAHEATPHAIDATACGAHAGHADAANATPTNFSSCTALLESVEEMTRIWRLHNRSRARREPDRTRYEALVAQLQAREARRVMDGLLTSEPTHHDRHDARALAPLPAQRTPLRRVSGQSGSVADDSHRHHDDDDAAAAAEPRLRRHTTDPTMPRSITTSHPHSATRTAAAMTAPSDAGTVYPTTPNALPRHTTPAPPSTRPGLIAKLTPSARPTPRRVVTRVCPALASHSTPSVTSPIHPTTGHPPATEGNPATCYHSGHLCANMYTPNDYSTPVDHGHHSRTATPVPSSSAAAAAAAAWGGSPSLRPHMATTPSMATLASLYTTGSSASSTSAATGVHTPAAHLTKATATAGQTPLPLFSHRMGSPPTSDHSGGSPCVGGGGAAAATKHAARLMWTTTTAAAAVTRSGNTAAGLSTDVSVDSPAATLSRSAHRIPCSSHPVPALASLSSSASSSASASAAASSCRDWVSEDVRMRGGRRLGAAGATTRLHAASPSPAAATDVSSLPAARMPHPAAAAAPATHELRPNPLASTVYITKLPSDLTAAQVRRMLRHFGEVYKVRLCRDEKDGASGATASASARSAMYHKLCFGFVEFADPACARAMVEYFRNAMHMPGSFDFLRAAASRDMVLDGRAGPANGVDSDADADADADAETAANAPVTWTEEHIALLHNTRTSQARSPIHDQLPLDARFASITGAHHSGDDNTSTSRSRSGGGGVVCVQRCLFGVVLPHVTIEFYTDACQRAPNSRGPSSVSSSTPAARVGGPAAPDDSAQAARRVVDTLAGIHPMTAARAGDWSTATASSLLSEEDALFGGAFGSRGGAALFAPGAGWEGRGEPPPPPPPAPRRSPRDHAAEEEESDLAAALRAICAHCNEKGEDEEEEKEDGERHYGQHAPGRRGVSGGNEVSGVTVRPGATLAGCSPHAVTGHFTAPDCRGRRGEHNIHSTGSVSSSSSSSRRHVLGLFSYDGSSYVDDGGAGAQPGGEEGVSSTASPQTQDVRNVLATLQAWNSTHTLSLM